jgi:ribonuclease P/MRP protein subunit POP1
LKSGVDIEVTGEEEAINGMGPAKSALHPWLLDKAMTLYLATIDEDPDVSTSLFAMMNAFRSQRGIPSIPASEAARLHDTALVHIRLDMLERGSPSRMAHIYALSDDERNAWLHEIAIALESNAHPPHVLGEACADQAALIGFTSTGNFSLSRGRGHALGSISYKSYVRLLRQAKEGPGEAEHLALVKVRNRDGRICRLASVHLV